MADEAKEPTVKTVQLPVEEWTLLAALAAQDDRSIASWLRNDIRQHAKKAELKMPVIKRSAQ